MSKNRNRNQTKVNAQDHAPEDMDQSLPHVVSESTLDSAPVDTEEAHDQTANIVLDPEDTGPEQTIDQIQSALASVDVTDPKETPVTAKVTPAPTAKVNLPNQNRSQIGDPKYVGQVTVPAERFIAVALKKDHSMQEFNSCKVNLYNSLRAAIRYPDANNFIGSMNAFLKLVREHRDTAFHESTFNMYTHRIELSEQAMKELPRIMSVFQVLTSPDAKNIGKLVDFSSVFLTKVTEEQVARFRMWALR